MTSCHGQLLLLHLWPRGFSPATPCICSARLSVGRHYHGLVTLVRNNVLWWQEKTEGEKHEKILSFGAGFLLRLGYANISSSRSTE